MFWRNCLRGGELIAGICDRVVPDRILPGPTNVHSCPAKTLVTGR
jgi:hypothetical protein